MRRFLNNMTLENDLKPYFEDVVTSVRNDCTITYSISTLTELLNFFNYGTFESH
jgi:hypothetical protein